MQTNHTETVSVIIPLYNAGSFLSQTIDSVLSQTYSDFKIYIIDDHSTDQSPDIAKSYESSNPEKIQYILMPHKGGRPSVTKNYGVSIATGKLIAFSDHDDWWDPTKLEKQVTYLDLHPEVNILGTNVAVVDTERNITLGNFWSHPEVVTPQTIRTLVLEGPILATTTCLISRSSYLKEHAFDESYLGADEYDLSLHATLDNPEQVAILPDVLAYWRWHETSLSHSAQAAARSSKDEEYFSDKLLRRDDLSEEERTLVRNRLWMVKRRAANTLLIEGKRAEARNLYRKVIASSTNPERATRIILAVDSLFPPLARWIVSTKKNYSYAKPAFR